MSEAISTSDSGHASGLSHLDTEGRARMVDVSAKADTARIAVAAGELRTTAEVVRLVRSDDMPKADVLATARLAGIGGAKKTSELIPLCHQLALSKVDVRFGFTDDTITIEATAKTKGPTGVEMEALTAVAVAGLTLHDMVKALDPAATLNGVRLLTKDGGKRGHWERPDERAAVTGVDAARHADNVGHRADAAERNADNAEQQVHGADRNSHGADRRSGEAERHAVDPERHADTGVGSAGAAVVEAGTGRAAAVLVASTGASAGTRVDKTGPVLVDWLAAQGFSVRGPLVYADAEIAAGLRDALDGEPALVITTGGTGASPSDATPEATLAVLDRELPGVAEEIRRRGVAGFPLAVLSRGVAGLAGRSVVVNLPGSPGGVRDGMAVLQPLLGHLLAQVAGGGNHE